VSCCSSDYCNGNVPSVRSPSFRRPKTSASLPSLKPSFPRSGLGISRVCYQCPSTDSLKDCNKKRIKITCKYGQPCVTASAHSMPEDNEVLYYKGCATTCVASDVPICSHPNVKCQIDCCHSDLCNKATIHVVSAVTLIFIVRMFFPDWLCRSSRKPNIRLGTIFLCKCLFLSRSSQLKKNKRNIYFLIALAINLSAISLDSQFLSANPFQPHALHTKNDLISSINYRATPTSPS